MRGQRGFWLSILGVLLFLVGLGGAGYRYYQTARLEAKVRTQVAAVATTRTRARPSPTRPPTPTRHPTRPEETPSPRPRPTSTGTPTFTPTPTPKPAPPVRLIIPVLDIDVPVVPVEDTLTVQEGRWSRVWGTADYAAGYHVNGAFPGRPGNVIISGHNNIKGEVFRALSVLGNPDVPFPRGAAVYLVDANGRVFLYELTQLVKVDTRAHAEEGIRWLYATRDPVLTLVTCWPLNNNTHRIIVRARFVREVDPSVLPRKSQE
ncbi:MAG: sortase [Chloroflexi bacterium]|nr:sortase [Chloroflexota bacterium]